MERIEAAIRALLAFAFGDKGFRVVSDDVPIEGHFYALRAVNGKIILGPETISGSGDNPVANHAIEAGDILHGNFSSVQRENSSDEGAVLYAYQRGTADETTL